jgi:hypothetical protein
MQSLSVDICFIKVGTSKNEAPSMHMSRDVVIKLADLQTSQVIAGDSEHPLILASTLLPLIFNELSTLAARDLILEESGANAAGTLAIAQGKNEYYSVSLF